MNRLRLRQARCEKLEREFSSAEKSLLKEVEGLREAVVRKEADIDLLALDLRSAREKRKADRGEAEALADRGRELEAMRRVLERARAEVG